MLPGKGETFHHRMLGLDVHHRELALRLVRSGDAILVKGSRSVGLEVVADALLEPQA